MSRNVVVLGTQWGDEGKGKATDLLATTDTIDFVVRTSGGHNAGVVSGPEHPRRRYRVHTRAAGDKYIDPDTWMEENEPQPGSWWPLWDKWLDQRSSARVAPPSMGAPRKGLKPLRDAPGEYVFG